MASSKVSSHSRSISLPSRSHPSTASVEEQLYRLRSSKQTSTSLKCNKLAGLQDLYECLDDLFQLPTMQQNLSGCAENVLGASLRLLDLCSTAKDAFLQMRASVQDLESSLRRKEADVWSKIRSYLICMKKVNNVVSKCFATVKKSKNSKNSETSVVVSQLREVEEVGTMIFDSLFSSIFPVKSTSRSLLSKLAQSKRVSCKEADKEDIHISLEALCKRKTNKEIDISRIQQVQKCLMAMDVNMRQCEEDLDCLFRSLLKTRVSLLNVLDH